MLEVWLESLAMHISVGHRLPSDLIFDIDHYKGTTQSRDSSVSSTPDGLGTPPACKTPRLKTPENELATEDVPDSGKDMTYLKSTESSNSNSKENSNSNSVKCSENAQTDAKEMATESINLNIPNCDDEFKLRNPPMDNKYLLREIPKSPHLSKDFSPNGERIRDSIRARRQQRMQQNRENLRKSSNDCSSAATNVKSPTTSTPIQCNIMEKSISEPISLTVDSSSCCTAIEPKTDNVLAAVKSTLEQEHSKLNKLVAPELRAKKTRPYGEKGFIINVNEGSLTLNSVKDLDNCSDFDSSCDTSLNYIDLNATCETDKNTDTKSSMHKRNGSGSALRKIDEHQADVMLWSNGICNISTPAVTYSPKKTANGIPVVSEISIEEPSKSYKSTLEELKSKLNLCRNKLESLETAGKQTISNSRKSMKNYFKIIPSVHSGTTSPTIEHSSKIDTNGTTISNSMFGRKNPAEQSETTASTTSSKSKLFRINDTPIFERRTVRSMFGTSLFKRSDSDDSIVPLKITSKPMRVRNEPIVHDKLFSSKQKISPTSDLKPNCNFNGFSNNCSNTQVPSTTTVTSPPKSYVFLNKTNNSSNSVNNNNNNCNTTKLNSTTKATTNKRPTCSTINSLPAGKFNYLTESNSNNKKTTTACNTTKTPNNRISLLTPERIHRLNAKLTETKAATAAAAAGGTTVATKSAPNNNIQQSHQNYLNKVQQKPTKTSASNQYQHNLLVHRLPNSPVRRQVNRFDKSTKNVFESTPL